MIRQVNIEDLRHQLKMLKMFNYSSDRERFEIFGVSFVANSSYIFRNTNNINNKYLLLNSQLDKIINELSSNPKSLKASVIVHYGFFVSFYVRDNLVYCVVQQSHCNAIHDFKDDYDFIKETLDIISAELYLQSGDIIWQAQVLYINAKDFHYIE